MTRQVFVVDTNVVVSGLLTADDGSPPARILNAMQTAKLLYLLSPDLLAEYRAVFTRPKLVNLHGLSANEIDTILTDMTANAIWREPNMAEPAPDPGDDHLWALLAAYPGSILVTGDQLLLENPPALSSVISPRGCLEII